MDDEKLEEKRAIVQEIERLVSHSDQTGLIEPSLLRYLDLEALRSIRDNLEKKSNRLNEEDRRWLRRFRKETDEES